MPSAIPNRGQVYFNILRDHNIAIKDKHAVEAKIERYENTYVRFPHWARDVGYDERTIQEGLGSLRRVIDFWKEVLVNGDWELRR